MHILPPLETVKDIAATQQYDVLPLSCEILSDFITPIEAMRILKNVSTHCYMLESAQVQVMSKLNQIECEKLKNLIEECNKILNNETELKNVMKSELREIKKNYAVPRKTEIRDEIVDIKVDAKEMIPDEKVIVVVKVSNVTK